MQSDQINELALSLSKAQKNIKNPPKNKTVSVTTRTGGRYEFAYADLTSIIDAAKEPLSSNGLSYVQYVEEAGDKFHLVTQLLHSSGQWLSGTYPLLIVREKDRDGNDLPPSSQQFGSALTFMKRYALAAMLGISADSDDDANAADGNTATIKDRQRKPKEPAPSPIRGGPQANPVAQTPTAIPVPPGEDGNADWMAWGRAFMTAANSAPSKVEAGEWLAANQATLKKMSEEAPKMFPRLEAALKEVYPKLLLQEGN